MKAKSIDANSAVIVYGFVCIKRHGQSTDSGSIVMWLMILLH